LNVYILNFFQRDALANLSAKVRFNLEGFGREPSANASLRLQGAKKGEAAQIDQDDWGCYEWRKKKHALVALRHLRCFEFGSRHDEITFAVALALAVMCDRMHGHSFIDAFALCR
jgi:hypothetical protein